MKSRLLQQAPVLRSTLCKRRRWLFNAAFAEMASNSCQTFSRIKEVNREGDGEEDDGEEMLDPRVKVR